MELKTVKAEGLLRSAQKRLSSVSVQPFQEGLWILQKILNLPLSSVVFSTVDAHQAEIFWKAIEQRAGGRPLEYILGEKFFYGRRFLVQEGVFIPRGETESLVREVLGCVEQKTSFEGVDFGAGCGPICLSLLSILPHSCWTAVEMDRKALRLLQANRKAFRMEKRLKILNRDVSLLSQKDLAKRPFLVTANPPYVEPGDRNLDKNVRQFEPPLALFSEQRGMGHIYSWFQKAMEILPARGVYIFEFGWNQRALVEKFLCLQKELSDYKIKKDFSQKPRVAICFKKT